MHSADGTVLKWLRERQYFRSTHGPTTPCRCTWPFLSVLLAEDGRQPETQYQEVYRHQRNLTVPAYRCGRATAAHRSARVSYEETFLRSGSIAMRGHRIRTADTPCVINICQVIAAKILSRRAILGHTSLSTCGIHTYSMTAPAQQAQQHSQQGQRIQQYPGSWI